MDVRDITAGISSALDSPEKGEFWVDEFLSSMTPEDLRKAVDEDLDPLAITFEKYRLAEPGVRRTATVVGRVYWGRIEDGLKSVPKIIERIRAKNPKSEEVLRDPKTVRWLNLHAQRSYAIVSEYLWGPCVNGKFADEKGNPFTVELACASCKKKFMYDVLCVKEMDFAGSRRRRVLECPYCSASVIAMF